MFDRDETAANYERLSGDRLDDLAWYEALSGLRFGIILARMSLRGDGNYVHFSLQAGGEFNDSYRALDAKAVFRMTF